MLAMSLCRVESRPASKAVMIQMILSGGRAQMGRIDAGSNFAFMVNVKTPLNGADVYLIHEPMSQDRATVMPEHAVAVEIDRPLPKPASVLVDFIGQEHQPGVPQ